MEAKFDEYGLASDKNFLKQCDPNGIIFHSPT